MSAARTYQLSHVGDNDIKMSFMDYHFMLDVLRDDRLTPGGLLKFKHLYQNKMESMSAALKMTIPWAIAGTLFIGTRAKKAHSGYG